VSPNWAEQVTAIATAVGALGLLGAIGAALFAGQQVKEERKTRQATMAADLFRRWDEDALVETRRLVAGFADGDELKAAFERYLAANAPETYVLYRELDFFEQLSALEITGAVDLHLIELMLGPTLVERRELWRPTIGAMDRDRPYPNFETLAARMRATLPATSSGTGGTG
jgi:hypothetical protein